MLSKSEPALAGYKQDGTPAYACNSCASLVVSVYERIQWWVKFDRTVKPEAILWRYMDLPRLISILETSRLFFCCIKDLEDVFEGARGHSALKKKWDQHYHDFYMEACSKLPDGSSMPIIEAEKGAKKFISDLHTISRNDRKHTYVNCWHASEHESEALWRLYCSSYSPGIALVTNYSSVCSSLPRYLFPQSGRVKYIDFKREFPGIHDTYFYKRMSLSYENEVRFLIRSHGYAPGIHIGVDLKTLIHKVVLSPYSPSWHKAILESLLSRYGCEKPVEQSSLLDRPFF
jgi:hypothetical protein